MFHIKQILKRTANGIIEEELDEELIIKNAEFIIKKDIPDIEVSFYDKKNLGVKCQSSIAANELFLNREKLRAKINSFFKRRIINKIIVINR
ncbi:MAG: DUF721 domain-containing protein [Candidatus Portnoybacteria bacterium]|nr:DUF721 domain-containing protein [Candidatus Portnoybacteria bacterium]